MLFRPLLPVLACAIGLFGPNALAHAQTTEDDAAQQQELDAAILGSWGFINNRGLVADEQLISAARACRRTKKIVRVEFQAGAEETLPPENERNGNIVYYRTDKGLQRLDTALRKVAIVTSFSRNKTSDGRTIWILKSPTGQLRTTFGRLRKRGRTSAVMIEENGIYLRCAQPKS